MTRPLSGDIGNLGETDHSSVFSEDSDGGDGYRPNREERTLAGERWGTQVEKRAHFARPSSPIPTPRRSLLRNRR